MVLCYLNFRILVDHLVLNLIILRLDTNVLFEIIHYLYFFLFALTLSEIFQKITVFVNFKISQILCLQVLSFEIVCISDDMFYE